jgi:DNA-binding transcriptional ArsR family regulator
MDKNVNELALVAQALSEPIRLKILQLLPAEQRCEDMYNVSELAEELGIAQPVVSRHLAILKRAGLVASERMCQSVYYAIDRKSADKAIAALDRTLHVRR